MEICRVLPPSPPPPIFYAHIALCISDICIVGQGGHLSYFYYDNIYIYLL